MIKVSASTSTRKRRRRKQVGCSASDGRINGSITEGEKTLSAIDPACILYPVSDNGSRPLLDTNLKVKKPGKAFSALLEAGSRGSYNCKNSMDSKNDKPLDFSPHGGKPFDKKDSLSLLNGIVSLSASHITNGYPCKSVLDNDGSGSENGYTTPKRRKARHSSIKSAENVSVQQEKTMQQGSAASHRQDVGPLSPEPEKLASPRLDSGRPCAKAEACTGVTRAGELQHKNSEGKATGTPSKKFEDRPGKPRLAASVTTKEDSWTLFKPPPVFPVDNSSAKIVPKISYASKVKENLNKAAQARGDTPPPQEPGRLSLVPMSALKTMTSPSFMNGPISGEGNGCLPAEPLFTTAASTVPLASPLSGGENVASSPDNDSSTTTTPVAATGEPRKSSLFVYPLTPTNMQLALPSACQVDTPAAQTNQKALGDIFRNQWGLSFINEPNAGPESKAGNAAEVTFQGRCPVATATQDSSSSPSIWKPPPFSASPEVDKRTSPLPISSVLKICPPEVPVSGGGSQTHPLGQDTLRGEIGSLSAIVFASSKDPSAEPPQACQTNSALALVKEQSQCKGFDRRCSRGSFDLKAAVVYHTKEIEYILNLQKQDPKRVIMYDETKDRPDQ
ncbi:FMR1-interacting protein NUFIP2-like isoform X2 [Conger conger]|uniref:FMR1-interacting protein NUFIP2-like isoform X2 n=1 Tax=Conger conger TaxID=82655 RepID=UPI002A5A9A9D|nr:FMR1-interacting protein NUFIP2-like isoform X2 [Conger conger]